MKKILLALIFSIVSALSFSQAVVITADHDAVAAFDNIPQQWIDSVETMLVREHGASHAYGLLRGCFLLESLFEDLDVTVWWEGGTITTEPSPNGTLRIGRPQLGGENIITDLNNGTDNHITAHLKDWNDDNPTDQYDVNLFNWSYQQTWVNGPTSNEDPVYNVRWYGSSQSGLDGNLAWGLDAADYAETSNRFCAEYYHGVVDDINFEMEQGGYDTKFFASTGIVDGNEGTERGFQRELKNTYLREELASNLTMIDTVYLWDYAEILSWDYETGSIHTVTWDDGGTVRPHAQISPQNELDYGSGFNMIPAESDEVEDHIGEVGAVRVAKAFVWLLARSAGWDGNTGPDTYPPSVPEGLLVNTVSESSVSISWNASTDNIGVSGYSVFRDGAFLETVAELYYTDNAIASCGEYSYTVSASDAAGNESSQSGALIVNNCAPDITPTMTLSPNVAHGVTSFVIIVRVTELNNVNTDGEITVHIPKDQLWDILGSYDPTLTIMGSTNINNSEWAYSEDGANHIFTSSTTILSGGASIFGFQISFDPGNSSGINPVTCQLLSGGGGEIHVSNNSDSEKLDYFQE